MKPKLIALNLLLVLALGAIGWQARKSWQQTRAKRQNTLNVKVKPLSAPPVPPEPKPDAAVATTYADVATKDLFSKDRNPTVIVVEVPKVEPPKIMPPLPVVYGVLGLPSGTKALMAEKAGQISRPVHEGDTIGAFKIAALDPQNVTFDWDGKQITKKIDDLIDRSTGPGAANGQPANPRSNNAAAAAAPPVPANVPPGPGIDTGGGIKACVPGDSSPNGTVVNGYRISRVQLPFGESCKWVPAQ